MPTQRPKVATAILGWGSLLWEGGDEFDRWRDEWRYDGPTLKLEFSRISKTRLGALTLVIDPVHGEPSTVAWCLSKRKEPDDAVADLRCREGCSVGDIRRLVIPTATANGLPEHEQAIAAWAQAQNLAVVTWTALPSKFEEVVHRRFSVAEALEYLKRLPPAAKAKAAEYVWCAPEFVRTPLRTALQQEPWFSVPAVGVPGVGAPPEPAKREGTP